MEQELSNVDPRQFAILVHLQSLSICNYDALDNKAGYTAKDAPGMRTFHLRKQRGTDGPTDGPTDGRTDTTSYRDATAHLKTEPLKPVLIDSSPLAKMTHDWIKIGPKIPGKSRET